MVQRQSQRPSRNPAPGVTRNAEHAAQGVTAVTDARQVRTAFEALVNEGYLYSTIDEHYKATA